MWARIRIGIEMAGAVISLSGMVHDLLMAGAVSPLMACLFVSFIVSLVWEFTGKSPFPSEDRMGCLLAAEKRANRGPRRTITLGNRAASSVVWVDGVLVWEYTGG